MHQPRTIKLSLILVVTFLTHIHAQAAELSNSKILGAIPQFFDNVGIVRYIDMDADTVVGSEFRRPVPVGSLPPTHAMPVGSYIAEQLYLDGQAITVTALSNQDVAPGTDYPARNVFRLYVAEQNTDDIKQEISSRSDIQQIDHAAYDIYRDNNPDNPTYVAFLNKTLILVTNNEDDIHTSGPALLAQETKPAPNWSALDAVDIDAPVLILRHLQYPMAPPPGADVPHYDNFLLGMWISDLSAPIFRLDISTDIPLTEAEHYIRTAGAIEAIAGPDGLALNLEQSGVPSANYSGTLEVLHNESGNHWTDLVFFWMLGIWFAI